MNGVGYEMSNAFCAREVFLASALYDGLEDCNVSHLQAILQKRGANPNVILPKRGISPFHLAIGNESEDFAGEVTRLFLQYGGNPNVRSVDGQTPVHIAAAWSRAHILHLLLLNGGDPWLHDCDGNNAFHYAYKERHWNVVEILESFCITDSSKEEDASEEKYILTFEKVFVHGKNVAYEYGVDSKPAVCTCQILSGTMQTCMSCDAVPWFAKNGHNHHDCGGLYVKDRINNGCDISTQTCETCSMSGTAPESVVNGYAENKPCREDEWIASQSCFVLSESSDYVTCDDCPVVLPDMDAMNVPQKGDRDTNCSKSSACNPKDGKIPSTTVSLLHSLSVDSFMSLSEEYKYSDEEGGVVLLERRFLVPSVSISDLQSERIANYLPPTRLQDEVCNTGQSTACDISVPSSLDYDTDVLRGKLKENGYIPGPIIPTTKRLYLRKLLRLQRKPVQVSSKTKVYSPELQRTIRDFNWEKRLLEYQKLEREVAQQFSQPEPLRRWREGSVKSSFTYLLLDPRRTKNLPCCAHSLNESETWSTFLSSIFYVGKGKRARPYSHLYQAFAVWNKKTVEKTDKKVHYILDIWKAGMGVVCLHVFQNVIPVEAYTHEAAMIDAIGLENLKNVRCGEYYGIAATWTPHQKRMLGTYLLYHAMCIFLHEGERQLRPGDIY